MSNPVKIKLCGLSRECDIEWANEIKPDYIGFVFARKSTRYLSPEKAFTLKTKLNHDILSVGVFVNEEVSEVGRLLKNGTIDIAQLHGSENEEYIEALREMVPEKKIIKAFRIDSAADIQRAAESSADFVLLDSGNGGTGTSFDWRLLKEFHTPYFLAGGLSSENVDTALEACKNCGALPYCLDVSSGIETDGAKDKKKMKEFVEKARNY